MHAENLKNLDPRLIDSRYTTLFMKFIELAKDPQTVNLGQGYPDMPVPEMLVPALVEASQVEDNHQYCRPASHLGIAKVAAEHYSKKIGRDINPATEIVVTTGASQGFYNFLEAYIKPGDEVVHFEPCFAYYLATLVHIEQVVLKPVSILKSNDFSYDFEEFKAAFSPKTRLLLLNSPHNPTGKVFSRKELEQIANFLRDNYPEVMVFADNVYCDMHFYESKHVEFASMPGMWERTVTSYSFGKTFGATGWRIGFNVGPQPIICSMQNLQALSIYCMTTPIMAAGEIVIKNAMKPYKGESDYFIWVEKEYQRQYQQIFEIFQKSSLNVEPIPSQGGFFLIAKIEKAMANFPAKYFYADYATNDHGGKQIKSYEEWTSLENPDYSPDYAFCHYTAAEYKVVFWPVSAFFDTMYNKPHEKKTVNYVRISVCRSQATVDRLRSYLLPSESK